MAAVPPPNKFTLVVSAPQEIDSKQNSKLLSLKRRYDAKHRQSAFLPIPSKQEQRISPLQAPEYRKVLATLRRLSKEVLNIQQIKVQKVEDPAGLSKVVEELAKIADQDPETRKFITALNKWMEPVIKSGLEGWQDEQWLTEYLRRTPDEHGKGLQAFFSTREWYFQTRIKEYTEVWTQNYPDKFSQQQIEELQELALAGCKAELLNLRFSHNQETCQGLISEVEKTLFEIEEILRN
jgi:hypothetical protein